MQVLVEAAQDVELQLMHATDSMHAINASMFKLVCLQVRCVNLEASSESLIELALLSSARNLVFLGLSILHYGVWRRYHAYIQTHVPMHAARQLSIPGNGRSATVCLRHLCVRHKLAHCQGGVRRSIPATRMARHVPAVRLQARRGTTPSTHVAT